MTDHPPDDDTPPALAAAARKLASGDPIDWQGLESSVSEGTSGDLLRQLQALDAISTFHRSWPGQGPVVLASGTAWGPLTIIREIGRGSFGRVYLARDPRLDRDVALKVLDPSVPYDFPHGRTIIEEGRHLARVRHHNVVTIHGADRVNGLVGLEMELIDGRTLTEIVRTDGALGADESALICRDVARALAAVHRAGLVHRDVKAQNVIRERGGRIVLMDFGAGGFGDMAALAMAGTPLYLAPEVLEGANSTTRSDLYSLGVLAYYLATGSFPVTAASIDALRVAHRTGTRTSLRDARPDLPERFVRLVEEALAPNPADRINSAGSLEAALSRTLERGDERPARQISQPAPTGASLEALVDLHGPRSADEAALIGRHVCLWLEATHRSGRTADGQITAAHVSRRLGGGIALFKTDPGSGDLSERERAYSAPEVLDGLPSTPSSDLYSVGVLLFFLATSALPRVGGRRLRDLRPDLAESFIQLVERALATTPDSRLLTAAALAAELSRSLGSVPASSSQPAGRSRYPAAPLAAAVVAAVLLAGSLWAWLGSGPSGCAAVPAGLMHWWPGDGSTGDVVGGDNGVVVGDVGYVSGVVGKAFRFGRGHVRLLQSYGGPSMREISILAWIRTHAAGPEAWQAVLSSTTSTFVHFQTSSIGGSAVHTSPDHIYEIPSFPATPTDSWRHVALAARTGEIQIYENGVSISRVPGVFTFIAPPDGPVLIGAGYGFERTFTGDIDDIQLYDRALSGDEVRRIFQAGSSGLCHVRTQTR